MSKVISKIDYLTKDFDGFKQLMMEQIPVIAPEWTDISEGDFGIILMELLCYGLDVLSFYQDKAVNESFLSTAQTRRAIINICGLLGYKLKQQRPSKHNIIFKKIEDYKDTRIVIEKGTMLSTDPSIGTPIEFEVAETLVIPEGFIGDEKVEKGSYKFKVLCIQGRSVEDELGVGNGECNQKFKLNYNSVIHNYLTVWTEEDGILRYWDRVDDFLDSNETSRHYVVSTNELDETSIEFGDGLTGMRPPSDCVIGANYRIGGGEIGDVGVNTINSFLENEVEGIESFSNPEPPVAYGCNKESEEHAKLNAPKMFKTNDRAVTKEDFEALSCNYEGIYRAKCEETFNEKGEVIVHIANFSFNETSEDLKANLKNYLDKKRLINNSITIKDANYKTFNVNVDITTFPEYSNKEVKSKVASKLKKSLDIKHFDFGQPLYRAYVIKELMLMNEVLDVNFNEPKANIEVGEYEILKLANLNVTVKGGID